ncbi:hypothetical protein KY363_06280 [Candidatus Woesearchaeota archaeon]|nr:hypothetical protein [Candidatus Woesearchaeota archaeon]
MRYNNRVSYAARLGVLCAVLFVLWYAVFLLTEWYDPVMHAIATLSSVFLVSTGRSTGILQKIVA